MKSMLFMAVMTASAVSNATVLHCTVFGILNAQGTKQTEIGTDSNGLTAPITKIGDYSVHINGGGYGNRMRVEAIIKNDKTDAGSVGEGFDFVSTTLLEKGVDEPVSVTCLFSPK
jgi:hypothetical protein